MSNTDTTPREELEQTYQELEDGEFSDHPLEEEMRDILEFRLQFVDPREE